MATALIPDLRRAFPRSNWEITASVPRPLRPLFCPLDGIDRWLGRPTTPGLAGIRAQARLYRLGRFDTVILLPNSFRSAAAARLACIPKRIGYARDGRGWLLNRRVKPRKNKAGGWLPEPAVDYYLRLVRETQQLPDHPIPPMRLKITPQQHRETAERLAELGINAGQQLILLNPGASKPAKRWPAERYARLANRLASSTGSVIAVTGSPAEKPILSEVVAKARTHVVNLAEAGWPIRLLKAVIARASLLVTNDTGPRHVAAAVITPVVTLFGPTGPEWTLIPFKHDHHVIAPDRIQTAIEPYPTFTSGTMEAITVEQVAETALRVFKSAGI